MHFQDIGLGASMKNIASSTKQMIIPYSLLNFDITTNHPSRITFLTRSRIHLRLQACIGLAEMPGTYTPDSEYWNINPRNLTD